VTVVGLLHPGEMGAAVGGVLGGRGEGVEDALLEEWLLSIPERSAQRKGWRWIGEMEEIAHSMAAQDLPVGFHQAAAEVFRRTAEES
jgi:hypothetical protein